MVANFQQLARNHRFLLKIIELLFVLICLGLLCHVEVNSVPRWLWIIYCINTVTYIVVLVTLAGSYVLEENCELLDTIVSVIGLPLYMIAGLGAIVRSEWYIPKDLERNSGELVIGIFFILIASLMISQVIWSVCEGHRRVVQH